jgi:hypothetical protein
MVTEQSSRCVRKLAAHSGISRDLRLRGAYRPRIYKRDVSPLLAVSPLRSRRLRSPVEYECDELAEDIEYLVQFPQAATALDLGLTERGWGKILKDAVEPLATTVEHMREVAAMYRLRRADK